MCLPLDLSQVQEFQKISDLFCLTTLYPLSLFIFFYCCLNAFSMFYSVIGLSVILVQFCIFYASYLFWTCICKCYIALIVSYRKSSIGPSFADKGRNDKKESNRYDLNHFDQKRTPAYILWAQKNPAKAEEA